MPNFVLELGQQAATLGVKSAFGGTQDVDGVQMVPVALVAYGFGGGEGQQNDDGPEGSGGGGGGYSIPVGAYVRSGDSLRFEPNLIALLAVGIPFVWVSGQAIARVVRALRK